MSGKHRIIIRFDVLILGRNWDPGFLNVICSIGMKLNQTTLKIMDSSSLNG